MDWTARYVLALSALIFLPLLEAYCPRLAPDVISGKIIPCRYLCIRINFFELPSIILSTERDGVLCSTLLLRRRGVCKNGGCIPFDAEEYKGAFGKAFSAIDKIASGVFKKIAPTPGEPSGPIVDTRLYTGGSNTATGPVVSVGITTPSPSAAGPMAGPPPTATGLPFLPKAKTEPTSKSSEAGKTPSIYPNLRPSAETAGIGAVSLGGSTPVTAAFTRPGGKSASQASPTPTAPPSPGASPGLGSNNAPGSPSFPIGASPSGPSSVPLSPSSSTAKSAEGSAGAATGGVSGPGGEASRGPSANSEPTSLASMYGLSS
ncbi:nascent polypeptide-associated complex subunit alpha, muscle-specific form isoform X3 [Rhipicephalus sanguineus]|uniref:nascent polypeptide-associated complex subunit alpha, muscle-specific form isoform X3 n=1 Tax=Rhipicephalus sanguineus TaxID=34632 RepID=UPI001893F073|nr:nascent polypeptide-associated complex subunit alpha, muscle-specific form isoform X3 [Rhipicephalus sanguineus]